MLSPEFFGVVVSVRIGALVGACANSQKAVDTPFAPFLSQTHRECQHAESDE